VVWGLDMASEGSGARLLLGFSNTQSCSGSCEAAAGEHASGRAYACQEDGQKPGEQHKNVAFHSEDYWHGASH